ncbi:hypothetical protein QAD02_019425 [Eretmocerus hayati]|uniref:Uncharacterized protein n=1 Tax=Eretmocerus hayati TaxID=131215 RepID=A0ACC2PJJ4_9HYME|nr:hypothetical protein QAD02_019425 [Eretmocerus hayati]
MSVKRQLSDSDCDDVFSEESGKEPCNSPGGDSCQHTSRKRRRGMIEKKRRDRINASLGELRRLVPAAARDPHSGKLEKAEILQLTVEHLRTLKNKGHEAGYDSTKLAMDYHAVGWGECAAEVGRYLVTMEGLDELSAAAAAAQYAQQGHGKPYRPWGAELAY